MCDGFIELPKDCNGEHIHINDIVSRAQIRTKGRVELLVLNKQQWLVKTSDSPALIGPRELKIREDPIESIISEHDLGNLTATQTIEKLKELINE